MLQNFQPSHSVQTDLSDVDAQAAAWADVHARVNATLRRQAKSRNAQLGVVEQKASDRTHSRSRSRSRSPSPSRRTGHQMNVEPLARRAAHEYRYYSPSRLESHYYYSGTSPRHAPSSPIPYNPPSPPSSPAFQSLYTSPSRSSDYHQDRAQLYPAQVASSPLSQVADRVVGPYPACIYFQAPRPSSPYSQPHSLVPTGAYSPDPPSRAPAPTPFTQPYRQLVQRPPISPTPPPSIAHLYPSYSQSVVSDWNHLVSA